jgi:lysyl-tRNA synthetase class II
MLIRRSFSFSPIAHLKSRFTESEKKVDYPFQSIVFYQMQTPDHASDRTHLTNSHCNTPSPSHLSISFPFSFLSFQEVSVRGWLHSVRDLGKCVFAQVRDGTGEVQIVSESPELNEALRGITNESIVTIDGVLSRKRLAKDETEWKPEIVVGKVGLVARCADALPVIISGQGLSGEVPRVATKPNLRDTTSSNI